MRQLGLVRHSPLPHVHSHISHASRTPTVPAIVHGPDHSIRLAKLVSNCANARRDSDARLIHAVIRKRVETLQLYDLNSFSLLSETKNKDVLQERSGYGVNN